MANVRSEIRRTQPGYVSSGGAVLFDVHAQYSAGTTYDSMTGEIIFSVPGLYSVKWWVATETAPLDTIEFALALSWDGHIEYIPGCSPIKTGQVSGFAAIYVKAEGTKLSLINTTGTNTVFSLGTEAKAYLLAMRVNPKYPGDLVGVYHANLSASGSFREVTVGNVVYRLQYVSSTAIAMYVRSTGETVTVDIKRSSQAGSAVDASSLDNYALTTSAQNMDSSISNNSTEMHRTWIRQKDPYSGLWSLHEVQLFPSAGGTRVSICVYLVYENIDLSGL